MLPLEIISGLIILNDLLACGVTPSFQNDRVVPIPKAGGNPASLGSWTPIILLNADYITFDTILMSRVSYVLPYIISIY